MWPYKKARLVTLTAANKTVIIAIDFLWKTDRTL